MSAVPELREELDRKSLDTVMWLLKSFENCAISKEQLSTGIDAMFMATSGLIDEGIIEMITETGKLTADIDQVQKRHFCLNDSLLSVSWEVGDCRIITEKRKSGIKIDKATRAFDTPADAKFAMTALASKLKKAGYEEL